MKNVYWEISQLDELIFGLCKKNGLKPKTPDFTNYCASVEYESENETNELVKYLGSKIDVEVNYDKLMYRDVEKILLSGKPLIIPLIENDEIKFIGILRNHGAKILLLLPGLIIEKYSFKEIRDLVCCKTEEKHLKNIKELLNSCGITADRLGKASSAVLHEKLRFSQVGNFWLFSIPQSRKIIDHISKEKVVPFFSGFIFSNILFYYIFILSWSVIGKIVFSLNTGLNNFAQWAFLLILLVPVNSAATWFQNITSIKLGSILKKRLLFGALKLNPDDLRHQGAGQLLGRVMESESVETLALTGGFIGFQSVIEIFFAIYLISFGPIGIWINSALFCWFLFIIWLGRNYFLRRKEWTKLRLSMSYDLTEKMTGHRTRIAQDDPEHYHDEENLALEEYSEKSKRMDSFGFIFVPIASRGWLLLALFLLVPNTLAKGVSPELIAILLGGILLAQRGLKNFASGFQQLAGASIAWNEIRLFYKKAIEKESGTKFLSPEKIKKIIKEKTESVVIDASGISFKYKGKKEFAIKDCNLKIYEKDKLLLIGESGSGKSTLLSLLSGIKESNAGKLNFRGVDFDSIGLEYWRKKIINAPQFHDNHIFSATFLFNLLLGRHWPPSYEDVQEAMNVCNELGLDSLINKMPGGLYQMVGETGWQLSHGEKNRVYIARTLLHKADIIILDESFAALDPEVLMRVMRTVLKRTKTLIVSAHP